MVHGDDWCDELLLERGIVREVHRALDQPIDSTTRLYQFLYNYQDIVGGWGRPRGSFGENFKSDGRLFEATFDHF